jgi:aminopeptidase N
MVNLTLFICVRAMENWAINTYQVNLMLWFEGESTQFEQWRQSAVIGISCALSIDCL